MVMSETNLMQKLADAVAEMSDQMSVEQMRLYEAYISKTREAKEAQAAFYAAADLETDSDARSVQSINEIRGILGDPKHRLSGSECVLLAANIKLLEGEDYTDTKRLNILLSQHDRKPANTTKIVDTLEKKSLLEIHSDGMHSHKTFVLTNKGQQQAIDLLAILKGPGERLAVVD